MQFYQMNGCGNRFSIFDGRQKLFRPDEDLVRKIADKDTGTGADQIIAIEPSARGDVFMRIWNADGSEVGACGNASRCVADLVMKETGRETLDIETEAGLLRSHRESSGLITVDMGSPLLNWEDIPLAERMDTRGIDLKVGPIDDPILARPACANMGNPHAVFFVTKLEDYNIPAIGPLVEHHPLFPEGTNVGFAQIHARDEIRLRVWERGAGLTLACGTGACAAVVCGARQNRIERNCRVILDGGELTIHWREEDDRVLMTGPVEMEFTGQIPI